MNIRVQLLYRRLYYLADLERNKEGQLIWKIIYSNMSRDHNLTLVRIEKKRKMKEGFERVHRQWLPADVREYTDYVFFYYEDGDLTQKEPVQWLRKLYCWCCSWAVNQKG